MSLDDFVAQAEAARAERNAGRVTWRKVSGLTGGGWSGIGRFGPRAIARVVRSDDRDPATGRYRYRSWIVVDGVRRGGTIETYHGLKEAQRAAAELLTQRYSVRRLSTRAPSPRAPVRGYAIVDRWSLNSHLMPRVVEIEPFPTRELAVERARELSATHSID